MKHWSYVCSKQLHMFDYERLRKDFRATLKYGMSLRAKAVEIGIDHTVLHRLHKRIPKKMDVDNIKKICDYLGTKVDDYFRGKTA